MNIAFVPSDGSGAAFSRSPAQARNGTINTYYAIARAYVPFQGFGKFDPTSAYNFLVYQASFPVLYTTLTEVWHTNSPSNTYTKTTVVQDYFDPATIGPVPGTAKSIVTGSAGPAVDYSSTSTTVTSTTVSTVGTAGTYTATLSTTIDFDARMTKCLSLLSSIPDPVFVQSTSFLGVNTWSTQSVYFATDDIGGYSSTVNTAGDAWIGCAARGMIGYVNGSNAFVETYGLQTIQDNQNTYHVAHPTLQDINGGGFVMCAKSVWKLVGSNPIATNFGSGPYSNSHLNIYCHTFDVDAPITHYTSETPTQPNPIVTSTIHTAVSSPQSLAPVLVLSFYPEDVYNYTNGLSPARRVGEFGFRSTTV